MVIRQWAGILVLAGGISLGGPATAGGWPVIDTANLAQAAQQFQQMTMQLAQLQQQYASLNGARGMADLVNNPALRRYLPADYQIILNSGYGNSGIIRANSKIYGINQTAIGANTDTARLFEANAMQAAVNRATAEAGYYQASRRFNDIQVLLDQINTSPDAKDIADLQARIQAEQVMLQNESIKLDMLAQLREAQRSLAAQQAVEISMKSTRGGIPRF